MAAKLTVTDLPVEMDSTTLERMAAKLTVTDLPVEMDSTTLERMAAKLTVTDLPVEMLVKIFSFLESKELPNLFTVCSKFNVAAKVPSLWRSCEFKFSVSDSGKISSFCIFFSEYPFFRALSITEFSLYSLEPLDNTSVNLNSFNHLFENLKQLSCLEFDLDLSNIVLPPSLRHLTCTLLAEVCIKDKFPFLDQCPNIERLQLEAASGTRPTNAVTSVLLKYQLTLSALYLTIDYFEEEWIPLIENCLSLKEFGIELHCKEEVNLAKIFGSSLSLRLELLRVIVDIISLPSFNGIRFPELKVLTIEYLENVMDILSVIKGMPKLHSLFLCVCKNSPKAGDLSSVVKSCETLRYLVIEPFGIDFEPTDELDIMIRELNEGSSEENRWKLSHGDSANFVMPSCQCFHPTKISIDQNQHKQLRLLDEW